MSCKAASTGFYLFSHLKACGSLCSRPSHYCHIYGGALSFLTLTCIAHVSYALARLPWLGIFVRGIVLGFIDHHFWLVIQSVLAKNLSSLCICIFLVPSIALLTN